MAASARKLVTADGVKTAIGGVNNQLVRGFCMNGKAVLVAVLEFHVGGIVDMSFDSPDPVFL